MDYSTVSSIFQGCYSVSSRFISTFSTVSSKLLSKSTLHNAECSHLIGQLTFKRCKRGVNPFDKSSKCRIFKVFRFTEISCPSRQKEPLSRQNTSRFYSKMPEYAPVYRPSWLFILFSSFTLQNFIFRGSQFFGSKKMFTGQDMPHYAQICATIHRGPLHGAVANK